MQGAYEWYDTLSSEFISLGYSICAADEAVFYKFEEDHYTIVAVATDDFTIVADTLAAVELIKKQLNERFELVDLGEVKWLLGFHITRDLEARTLSMGQQSYIDEIIAEMGLENAAPVMTPMEPGVDLSYDAPGVSDQLLSPAQNRHYRKAIGRLLYVSRGTRPDIAFALSHVAQFGDAARTTHLKAVQRIFKYLKGTRDLRLVLGGVRRSLFGYSDSDWASQAHRHSISGYTFFLGNGAISWSSKKQPIVTLSSTESEYVALTHASKELIWLRKLLSELRLLPTGPTTLFCDNQGAIVLSRDSTYHARTKHIDIRFHFIRQTIRHGHASVTYCSTHDMIADVFTKSLTRAKIEKFRDLLGVEEPPTA
ncbi:Retrovirus-related Pol polyprotein from transposon TNT 1-94 [Mycena sanguinolenta]|uniref:Retrovirus-related Pol polyprotein from transposon TNT 1-94 n=1 Tax=Mycena sanguinolenta TaxID=230812 RepID=A0A8H7CY76_9AGAR|nr:Retrovirus-related Pol polyprotein from transposon TNT 1-94 [Mycena sanguinolenta]